MLKTNSKRTSDDSKSNPTRALLDYGLSMKVEDIQLHKLIPAPRAWNYFLDQSVDEDESLKESIRSIGQQNPIIVWKDPDLWELPYEEGELPVPETASGYYVILCGRRRSQAFKALLEEGGQDSKKYAVIQSIVYEDINADTAREIIIDENAIRREQHNYESLRTLEAKLELHKINAETLFSKETTQKEKNEIFELLVLKTGLSTRWIKELIVISKLSSEIKNWALAENEISIKTLKLFARTTNDSLENYLTGKISRKSLKKDVFLTVIECLSNGVAPEDVEKRMRKGKLKKPRKKYASVRIPSEKREFISQLIKAISDDPKIENKIYELIK